MGDGSVWMRGCDDRSEDGSRLSLDGSDGSQMMSSEDEDSDGSDGWSDGQDGSDEELRR